MMTVFNRTVFQWDSLNGTVSNVGESANALTIEKNNAMVSFAKEGRLSLQQRTSSGESAEDVQLAHTHTHTPCIPPTYWLFHGIPDQISQASAAGYFLVEDVWTSW